MFLARGAVTRRGGLRVGKAKRFPAAAIAGRGGERIWESRPEQNNPDLETYGAGSMERDKEKERENRMKEAEYMDVIKSSQ